MRALVIQHEEAASAGLLGEWLMDHGTESDVLRIDDPVGLMEETRRNAAESRQRALQLFERFLVDVAGLGRERRRASRPGSAVRLDSGNA